MRAIHLPATAVRPLVYEGTFNHFHASGHGRRNLFNGSLRTRMYARSCLLLKHATVNRSVSAVSLDVKSIFHSIYNFLMILPSLC